MADPEAATEPAKAPIQDVAKRRTELEECEALVAKHLKCNNWAKASLLLLYLHDTALFHSSGSSSWKCYVWSRKALFGIGCQLAQAYLESARILPILPPTIGMPSEEIQARPLRGMDPRAIIKTWIKVNLISQELDIPLNGSLVKSVVVEGVPESYQSACERWRDYASLDSEYYRTPYHIVDAVKRLFGGVIDLDPCSDELAQVGVQSARFYTAEDDGLQPGNPWAGRVYVFPPVGMHGNRPLQSLFLERAIKEYQDGRVTEVVLLLKTAIGRRWFNKVFEYPHCFLAEKPLKLQPPQPPGWGVPQRNTFAAAYAKAMEAMLDFDADGYKAVKVEVAIPATLTAQSLAEAQVAGKVARGCRRRARMNGDPQPEAQPDEESAGTKAGVGTRADGLGDEHRGPRGGRRCRGTAGRARRGRGISLGDGGTQERVSEQLGRARGRLRGSKRKAEPAEPSQPAQRRRTTAAAAVEEAEEAAKEAAVGPKEAEDAAAVGAAPSQEASAVAEAQKPGPHPPEAQPQSEPQPGDSVSGRGAAAVCRGAVATRGTKATAAKGLADPSQAPQGTAAAPDAGHAFTVGDAAPVPGLTRRSRRLRGRGAATPDTGDASGAAAQDAGNAGGPAGSACAGWPQAGASVAAAAAAVAAGGAEAGPGAGSGLSRGDAAAAATAGADCDDADGEAAAPDVPKEAVSPEDFVVVYIGRNPQRFSEVFSELGYIPGFNSWSAPGL